MYLTIISAMKWTVLPEPLELTYSTLGVTISHRFDLIPVTSLSEEDEFSQNSDIAEYRNGYIEIRKRGGKIKCFTEITEDNVYHCKELMRLVDELKHLDGVRGGMAVSESECMATTVLQEAKPLTQAIYSNVKEVVEQGQYIFDTLWNTAIPADQKIREIEEGIMSPYNRVINEPNTIIKEIIRINDISSEMSICATAGGMQFTYIIFFKLQKGC